jgi:hypothetical protein
VSITQTFEGYVEARLAEWGSEFALHRDCEYLGHQSKNMLQVLIEHKGEMPARPTGFKPLDIKHSALQVEYAVHELGIMNKAAASVLRAWYCGRGRIRVERLEIAQELIGHKLTRGQYQNYRDVGFAYVAACLKRANAA